MSDAQKALVAGIIGVPLFGFFTIYLFFFSDRSLSQSDIEVVRGNVARVEVVRAGRNADALQIWLTSESVPFRGSAGYPGFYNKEALAHLTASASVEIGILPTERIKPRRDRVRAQDFIPIHMLTVAGTPALTLDNYNRWNVENQKVGKYVASILLLCAFFLLGYGLRHRRRSREAPPNEGSTSNG